MSSNLSVRNSSSMILDAISWSLPNLTTDSAACSRICVSTSPCLVRTSKSQSTLKITFAGVTTVSAVMGLRSVMSYVCEKGSSLKKQSGTLRSKWRFIRSRISSSVGMATSGPCAQKGTACIGDKLTD